MNLWTLITNKLSWKESESRPGLSDPETEKEKPSDINLYRKFIYDLEFQTNSLLGPSRIKKMTQLLNCEREFDLHPNASQMAKLPLNSPPISWKSSQVYPAIAREIFEDMADTLGETRTSHIFESTYKKLYSEFHSSSNFSVILRLLPEEILDERKIQSLDKVQIKEAFFDRILILKELTKEVSSKNAELMQAQEKIENQKVQMIASDRLKVLGEMAGGIAHEINNPLAIIKGKVEIIEGEMSDDSNNEFILRQIKDILKTTERIATIVRGLQLFARDGQADPLIYYSVDTILNETASICLEKLKSHNVKFDLMSSLLSVQIKCRPSQISQVILNLLNNSLDAIKEQDQPWIKIRVEPNSGQGMLEIIVTDSGAGIPSSLQDKIMNPFFTTKDVGHGTGLGLSLSKGIMESQNGELFYDVKASNTQFIVRIPFKKNIIEEAA